MSYCAFNVILKTLVINELNLLIIFFSKIRNERLDEGEIRKVLVVVKSDWDGDEQVAWEPVGVCVKQQLITRVWCAYQVYFTYIVYI